MFITVNDLLEVMYIDYFCLIMYFGGVWQWVRRSTSTLRLSYTRLLHCVKHLTHSNKLYRYDPCSSRTLWHDDDQFRVSTFRHVLTAEARQSMVEHPLNVRLVLISILRDTPIEVFQFQTVLQNIHECYEIIALLAL